MGCSVFFHTDQARSFLDDKESISFVALVTCTIIGGELISDVVNGEDNFPQVPEALKVPAILVFMGFAALEANADAVVQVL